MKKEAVEKKIIENMTGIIKVNYDDEKDDNGFNGQEFMSKMYSDEKRHFFQHPSTWVDACCKDIKYEEQMELFKKLFKLAWNSFAKIVTK